MDHPALKAPDRLLCTVINKFGSGQHPYADPESLPFFKRAYVIDCMAKAVRSTLTPDLIRKEYRDAPSNPLYGHCCHASVALFLLLGGKEKHFTIWKNTDDRGVLHYWLTDDDAQAIVDPTSEQYTLHGRTPPYEGGKRVGYQMSNAIKAILDRVASITA